jgi:hypothetical protein
MSQQSGPNRPVEFDGSFSAVDHAPKYGRGGLRAAGTDSWEAWTPSDVYRTSKELSGKIFT